MLYFIDDQWKMNVTNEINVISLAKHPSYLSLLITHWLTI